MAALDFPHFLLRICQKPGCCVMCNRVSRQAEKRRFSGAFVELGREMCYHIRIRRRSAPAHNGISPLPYAQFKSHTKESHL